MADDIGYFNDKLRLPQQRGMDAQVVTHENNIFHLRLKAVRVQAGRRVQRHSLGADGHTGLHIVCSDGHGKRPHNLSAHFNLTLIGSVRDYAAFKLVVLTDEVGHEQALRLLIQGFRRGDLGDPALFHDCHPVRQDHGFVLIVGHVDHRYTQPLLQGADLVLHFFT